MRIRVQIDSIEVLGRALRQRALDFVVGESTILEGIDRGQCPGDPGA